VPHLIDCCVLRAFRGLPLARQPFVRFIVYSLMAGIRPWILFLLMLLTRPALVPFASSLFADIRVRVVRRIDFLWSSPLLVDCYIAIIAFTITSPRSMFPSIASAITNSSARSCLHHAFAGSRFLWPMPHQQNKLLLLHLPSCHIEPFLLPHPTAITAIADVCPVPLPLCFERFGILTFFGTICLVPAVVCAPSVLLFVSNSPPSFGGHHLHRSSPIPSDLIIWGVCIYLCCFLVPLLLIWVYLRKICLLLDRKVFCKHAKCLNSSF
jgi:hypothetical protein